MQSFYKQNHFKNDLDCELSYKKLDLVRTKGHINKQESYCLTLVRKAKKDYCNKLHHKDVTDNRTFWESIKPLSSGKS